MSKLNWSKKRVDPKKYKRVTKRVPYDTSETTFAYHMWMRFRKNNFGNYNILTIEGKKLLYNEYKKWMLKIQKEPLRFVDL